LCSFTTKSCVTLLGTYTYTGQRVSDSCFVLLRSKARSRREKDEEKEREEEEQRLREAEEANARENENVDLLLKSF